MNEVVATAGFICRATSEPLPKPESKLTKLTDAGKQRIRSVVDKFKKDAGGRLDLAGSDNPQDLGFKVFKLAKPNIEQSSHDEERDPEHTGRSSHCSTIRG